MTMTHKQRIETAWSFREPDRIPIEVNISAHAQRYPAGTRLMELINDKADNLEGVPGLNSGFFGFPIHRQEETIIEDQPGRHHKKRHVLETAAGTFTAITYHPVDDVDYHWEKRYIATFDDFLRLTDTPRAPLTWNKVKWQERAAHIGERALPIIGLEHPLGALVRNVTMESVYAWFYEERETMHRFLESANTQIANSLDAMMRDGIGPYFAITAHEMLLPPWMGHALFDEFVFPYDKRVNDVIHRYGGKLRAHCHGNCMDFLEQMADMGIDAIEPLEHPPAGDVNLAEAKRRVGHRMMLSGNIASERFIFATPKEVREEVKTAIRVAAPGGGFALRTSGGHAGTCMQVPDNVMAKVLANVEAFIQAGLDYGQYPIRR
ncbi:MAG: hypothetical protein KKG09_11110 [Verrucomicrobia bacterium]|nr:hypothetical protein [Verrucomicrobiota bacterium]MCG2678363.1 hypothetical protein [Kiritimatiellia bacterium]MBU4247344.1 hypothetical protein [Verrucomicrobiota bacterium]MBU4291469.1 hypothetical protein [Verrucomicrobiota bacterium]MBU4428733.1 hypothetical protein [Verrucomicrobiota bacterium]